GLLGWVAGEMLVSDPAISLWVDTQLPWAHTGGPVLATLAVVGTGKWVTWEESAQEVQATVDAASAQPTLTPPVAVETVDASAAALNASVAGEAARSAPASLAYAALDAHDDHAAPPIGYRWVSSPWHTGSDGTRDYAAMHGLRSFRALAPMSGRVR